MGSLPHDRAAADDHASHGHTAAAATRPVQRSRRPARHRSHSPTGTTTAPTLRHRYGNASSTPPRNSPTADSPLSPSVAGERSWGSGGEETRHSASSHHRAPTSRRANGISAIVRVAQ